MATESEIWNFAIDAIGGTPVADTSDRTTEGTACSRWYEQCRREVLTHHPWKFAAGFVSLGAELSDPEKGQWQYAYQLPSDMLVPRVLCDADGWELPDEEWDRQQDGVILCNVENAMLKYTADYTKTGYFTPGFVVCLAARLALAIARPVNKKDMVVGLKAEYLQALANWTAKDARQVRSKPVHQGRMTRARRGTTNSDWRSGWYET